MIKVGLVKIRMIGDCCLILLLKENNFNKFYQLFTLEEHDALCFEMESVIEKRQKYYGDNVFFNSINKNLTINKLIHDFHERDFCLVDFKDNKLNDFINELSEDGWEDFDIETWGK